MRVCIPADCHLICRLTHVQLLGSQTECLVFFPRYSCYGVVLFIPTQLSKWYALFAFRELVNATPLETFAPSFTGLASADLAQAAQYCRTCSLQRGGLQAVWKLMGDIHLQFHAATPPSHVSHMLPCGSPSM